ncbi:MAG: hypothetical protein WDM77_15910 [Steroidobacteraceae bacterium]
MRARRVLLYFAWSRPAETSAPLFVIDDRFPAVFELRRLFYPKFEQLADSGAVDQGIAGFLDHIQKPNFQAFAEQAEALTGQKIIQVERFADEGSMTSLDAVVDGMDTIVVISFDSFRTGQAATEAEVAAIRRFLDDPDHLIFVCPHHDIGEVTDSVAKDRVERQLVEYLHHGDHAIPPRQGFGGFARTLLAGLGVPVENRFGLRPAGAPDGQPEPIEADHALDELDLLRGVTAFNLHPHLPQLERMGPSKERMEILARQKIDLTAPPHPFTQGGRSSFDALLQSRSDTFAGKLLVCDTTMFSSTAGGIENLRRFWTNVIQRSERL